MEEQKDKQKYEKPVLKVIELVAEEVLGNSCRTLSGGSAMGNPTCVGSGCFGAGNY